jgi:hypothetical protein
MNSSSSNSGGGGGQVCEEGSLLNAPTLGVFRECWADLTVLGSFQGDAMPAAGDWYRM